MKIKRQKKKNNIKKHSPRLLLLKMQARKTKRGKNSRVILPAKLRWLASDGISAQGGGLQGKGEGR